MFYKTFFGMEFDPDPRIRNTQEGSWQGKANCRAVPGGCVSDLSEAREESNIPQGCSIHRSQMAEDFPEASCHATSCHHF